MRSFVVVAVALSVTLSAGCQLKAPTGAAGKLKPAQATGTAATPRVIDPADLDANAPVRLSGLARLISDNGLGIISNNGGGIISNNGGGLISNNGGSYRVSAGALRPETLLADAVIEVHDAQGRRLTDRAGRPIGATTDKKGNYTLTGVLPRENLILRIRLWNGGVLTSLLTNADGDGEPIAINLDTATSLGATYVLEQYVKQKPGVLNLLPRTEADGLTRAIEAARGALDGTPTYKPADLVQAAGSLRIKAKGVDEAFVRIEAILLAGQQDLGNGLPATEVPLVSPTAVAGDGAGKLYIAETATRRIRQVDARGIISQLALTGENLGNPTAMVRAQDGTLFLACPVQNKVFKVAPDGYVSLYAGSGVKNEGQPSDGPAIRATLAWPTALALAPDGTLYIGEVTKGGTRKTRILAVDTAGMLKQVPTGEAMWTTRATGAPFAPSVAGLGVMADGALLAGVRWGDKLARRPVGGAWEAVADGYATKDYTGLVAAPDGTIYASSAIDHVVWAFAADDTRRVVAGTKGRSGAAGDGGPATAAQLNEPTGLWLSPDGVLFIADAGNALIRTVDRSGILRTVAGTTGLAQQGDIASLGLNGPTGLANDAQGRLVLAESGTATIKRLDGQTLSIFLGGTKLQDGEPNGDGQPAAKTRLIGPGQIAFHGDEFYFMDAGALRLRKLGKDGLVRTVAGKGLNHNFTHTPRFKADADFLVIPSGLAIAPDGTPYFADARNHHIYRLVGDQVEVVAGALPIAGGHAGDGGPAAKAKLSRPSALAFAPDGSLYVADTGNLVIRKIAQDGTITTVAGLGLQASLGKFFGFSPGADEGAKASESLFVVPLSLAFDPAGNLYVGEAGTSNVDLMGDKLPIPAALVPKIGARVRKIAPDGTVTTVVGPGGKALTEGELLLPLGLLVDTQGRLVISDGASNQVWMLPKGGF